MLRDTDAYYISYSVALKTKYGFGPGQLLDWSDGWGAVHAKEGYAFEFAKALERTYGFTFSTTNTDGSANSYRNWSFSGTNSSNSSILVPGEQVPRDSGLYPSRINAMTADIIAGQTLVMIGFGMNERGSLTTYANLMQIAQLCKTAGAEVIFMSTVRPLLGSVDDWRFTCQETVRAALDSQSAFYDAAEITSPENLCGLGLCDFELSDTTYDVHEGLAIQVPNGRNAAQIFIGG